MRLNALALLACVALSGCLLPNAYKAEITIAKDGRWTATYDGELAYLTGLRDMKAGRINAAAVEKGFAEALTEVSGVTADTPLETGIHRVAFARDGRLAPGVTAIPGPARMVLVEVKDGEAYLATPAFTDYQLKQLKAFGRPSVGELCVRTELPVVAHNAQEQAGGCHLWRLDLLAGGRVEMRLSLPPTAAQ